MKNPYEVLGVSKESSQDDIRKAFRKLAKKYHPDVNPGNDAAELRFKQANAAYDLLSDPAKRARFDKGEIDAAGAERYAHAHQNRGARPGGFQAGGFGSEGFRGGGFQPGGFQAGHTGFSFTGSESDLGDILNQMFGDQGFEAAGFGQDRHRTRPVRGADLRQDIELSFEEAATGTKRRLSLPDGRHVDVTIPEGVENGQTLRLKGKGLPGASGGQAGDLLLTVAVRPHPLFRRSGNDVLMDLPVALDEAVLGAKVTVPTLSGKVALGIPPGSNSGTKLRLKGKGVKNGDLFVTLQVKLPEAPDDELKGFLEGWRQRHGYDPRSEITRR